MRPRRSITMLLMVAAVTVGWSHGHAAQPGPTGEFVIAWALRSLPPGSTRPRPLPRSPLRDPLCPARCARSALAGRTHVQQPGGACLKSRFCTRFMTFFTYKTVNFKLILTFEAKPPGGSWTESPDGLVYEFKLRQGLRFHNGDPCTAEDRQVQLRTL